MCEQCGLKCVRVNAACCPRNAWGANASLERNRGGSLNHQHTSPPAPSGCCRLPLARLLPADGRGARPARPAAALPRLRHPRVRLVPHGMAPWIDLWQPSGEWMELRMLCGIMLHGSMAWHGAQQHRVSWARMAFSSCREVGRPPSTMQATRSRGSQGSSAADADGALLQLARLSGWQQCPSCRRGWLFFSGFELCRMNRPWRQKVHHAVPKPTKHIVLAARINRCVLWYKRAAGTW